MKKQIKYGIVIMRAQPKHHGHDYIIDRIISDGLTPIILIGSAQEARTTKNPYTVKERKHMLALDHPGVLTLSIPDYTSWDMWYETLINLIRTTVTDDFSEVTIYLHEKIEDLQDFTFRGIDYTNESYCKMYEIDGLHTTSLCLSNIDIRAKSIRADLESNKQYLSDAVYQYIKTIKLGELS